MKFIVFDFDGTLVDSSAQIVRAINKVGKKKNLEKLKKKDLEQKSRRELIAQLGLSLSNAPGFFLEVIQSLKKEMPKVDPYPGTEITLKKLRSLGFRLGIVSANTVSNISLFLESRQWNYFEFVESSSTKLFGKSVVLKSIMKKYNLQENELIYVGDEARDIVSAHRAGIQAVAALYGFNTKEQLLAEDPEFNIDAIQALLKLPFVMHT